MVIVTAILLAAWLLAITVVDIREFRIPNALSLPLIALGLAYAFFESSLPLYDHVLGASFGYGSLAMIGTFYFRIKGREGLGLGDAKLLGAAGAWTGWLALPFVLLVASLSGLALALLSRRLRASNARIAFGPHLAAGFWLIWMFGAPGLQPEWR